MKTVDPNIGGKIAKGGSTPGENGYDLIDHDVTKNYNYLSTQSTCATQC